jgi:nucleotide-binding universal stress UspA family protein
MSGLDSDRAIESVASSLGGELSAVHVEHPREDALLRSIVDTGADLLVMGLRPSGQSRRVLARRMAMKAPCSVLAVPVGWTRGLAPVLVAVDFSEMSVDTLRTGIAVSRQVGGEGVCAFHAYFEPTAVDYEGHAAVLSGQQELEMLRLLRKVGADTDQVQVVMEESVDVARAIQDAADACDAGLVVMGTRGRSRSAAVLLGSETEHALQATTRPLLVVKHHGASMGLRQVLLDARVWGRDTARFG